jgi:hypothetical protein
MAADIEEAAQHAVAATDNQERLSREFGGEVVERIRDLIAPANDLPRFPKKLSTFAF